VRFYCFFNYDEAAAARVVSVLTRPPSIAFLASDYYFFEKNTVPRDWLRPGRGSILHTVYLSAAHHENIYTRFCTARFATGLSRYIYNAMCAPSVAWAREWDTNTFICRCTLWVHTYIAWAAGAFPLRQMICETGSCLCITALAVCECLMLIFIYIMFAQVPIANTFNGLAKIYVLTVRLKRIWCTRGRCCVSLSSAVLHVRVVSRLLIIRRAAILFSPPRSN
jgi:hypothetical protein